MKGARIETRKDAHAEDHEEDGDQQPEAGERAVAECDKNGNEDAVSLGDECGSGGGGVTEPIGLENDASASEKAETESLPDFRSGEARERAAGGGSGRGVIAARFPHPHPEIVNERVQAAPRDR